MFIVIVGFVNPPSAVGGPGTFQVRLTEGLKACNLKVVYPEDDITPDVILLLGATKRLWWVLKCRKKGTKIIQRVADIPWRHKVVFPGLRSYIYAVQRKIGLHFVRKFLADHIIYQSEFAKNWWEEEFGVARISSSIINNGTNLSRYKPKSVKMPETKISFVCVEGNISDDPCVITMLDKVSSLDLGLYEVEINVYGNVDSQIIRKIGNCKSINFHGYIDREAMAAIYQENHVFLSLEINAACPNSIIEALASGLPVIAYKTGASPELINDCGVLVDYVGDPWKLDQNTIDKQSIADISKMLVDNMKSISLKARERALNSFDINHVVHKYISVFQTLISENNNE